MRRLAILLFSPLAICYLPDMASAQNLVPPSSNQAAMPANVTNPPPQAGSVPMVNAQPSTAWVRASPQGNSAQPSGQTLSVVNAAQPSMQSAFPASGYGPGSYSVVGQGAGSSTQAAPNAGGANDLSSMPPLMPPTNFQRAEQGVSPFSGDEIIRLRQQLDKTRRAKSFHPVRAVPRISSMSVDLSPGSALPIARTLPGETTTLVFVDATGAPWPLAALPRISDPRYFDLEWLQGTPSIVVSALSPYEDGNVTVFLQGLATPVVVKLSSGEADSTEKNRVVDYRLDLRVPGRGPNAKAPLIGASKIALYDDTMQAFLDGVPPTNAKKVAMVGDSAAGTQVWQLGGALFVRTPYEIQSAFDQSMASADGTKVYRLGLTPYVTLAEAGRSVTLQLDIN